jgi:two-component system, OmpR family, response regulator MprA
MRSIRFVSPPQARNRVLVVDDDAALRNALTRALELEGYLVDAASDGATALTFFAENRSEPDAVVLDVLMPGLDGVATCRAIRQTSRVPILMLTARHSVDDRIEGLDAGADDYLGKPFAVRELLARLRALLRRTARGGGVLRYAGLELDRAERRAWRNERRIELTRIEYSLLELFLTHPRTVLSRVRISREVWGYDPEYTSNSLEVYIGYLRRKTEVGDEPRLIHTVRGVGYVLREDS